MELEVENFGPIKEGKIETKKVTVLIGNQGSGKSTVAKLLSTFCWIEKDLFRYDEVYSEDKINKKYEKKLLKFLEYHRIEKYFTNSYVAYKGDVLGLCYFYNEFVDEINIDSSLVVQSEKYLLPKITYFPAERNFVSSIKNVKEGLNYKLWSKSLQDFKEIFQEAKEGITNINLPINNTEIEYNKLNDILYVKGENYKIPLVDAASGFQSFVPLFIVSDYLSKKLKTEHEMNSKERAMFKKELTQILSNSVLTEEQKQLFVSTLADRINIKRTINIIEEPEQNLYPSSQRNVLNSLLEFNNEVKGNELIFTTHSPYILSYLMLAIQAAEIKEKAKGNPEILSKLYEIVPEKAITPMKDVVVYELNDNGTISELPQSYGLPSDDNFLNNELGKANSLFSELMEIENLCQE